MQSEKCICGLAHSKPLPKKFDYAPIVGVFPPGKYYCHVCGATTKTGTNSLFYNPGSHNDGCEFAEYLKHNQEDKGGNNGTN